MSDEELYIPNINEVMTKQEQAQALLDEELNQVKIGKNEKTHTAKQIKAAVNSLIHFFPALTIELSKEHELCCQQESYKRRN